MIFSDLALKGIAKDFADEMDLVMRMTEAELVRDSILSMSVAQFTSEKARYMNKKYERREEIKKRPLNTRCQHCNQITNEHQNK